MANQTPEQRARDKIDKMLVASGWVVQNKNQINFNAGLGVGIRKYQTDIDPADYVLFVDRQPVGIVEAKKEEEGYHLTVVEEQSGGYAKALFAIKPVLNLFSEVGRLRCPVFHQRVLSFLTIRGETSGKGVLRL